MQCSRPLDLKIELPKYGLTENNIHLFNEPISPNLIDYTDLVEPRRQNRPIVDGVVESQGRPLLYFVNDSNLFLSSRDNNAKFHDIRRILACRGDPVYLALVRPGELEVAPVNLSDRTPIWQQYQADSRDAITFYSRLAQGHFDGTGEPDESNYVFKEMLNLLNHAAIQLSGILGPKNVLSLIGRALFFRFLYDRDIITEQNAQQIAPRANNLLECFDNAENIHSTNSILQSR